VGLQQGMMSAPAMGLAQRAAMQTWHPVLFLATPSHHHIETIHCSKVIKNIEWCNPDQITFLHASQVKTQK